MPLKKSDLYSSIWASCDELRGGMDASQYNDYVLFMLFIKYISDKYGKLRRVPGYAGFRQGSRGRRLSLTSSRRSLSLSQNQYLLGGCNGNQTSVELMLKTKSVWSSIDRKADGLRILATRFRGRGMRTTRYDVWMPSLGPSERLLKAIHTTNISWAKFVRGYKAEMFMDGPIDARSRSIKNHGQKFTMRLIKRLARSGHVTLMCHCSEDQDRCHRHVLRKLILSGRI